MSNSNPPVAPPSQPANAGDDGELIYLEPLEQTVADLELILWWCNVFEELASRYGITRKEGSPDG